VYARLRRAKALDKKRNFTMRNAILMIIILTLQSMLSYGERIKLENTRNYTLKGFELPKEWRAIMPETILTERAGFYWKRVSPEQYFEFGSSSGLISKYAYMAVLKTPQRFWVLVSKQPNFEQFQLVKAGKIYEGASIDVDPIELTNNFAVVNLDEKKSAEHGWDAVYLDTVWDPANKIYNPEFQEDLYNWLRDMKWVIRKEGFMEYFPKARPGTLPKPNVTPELTELMKTLSALANAL
jgi:hypothetical protein